MKITSILSCPRLAFTENLFCAFRSMPLLGIQIVKHTGAFWEQSLSRLLYQAIKDEFTHVITFDYDGVFTKGDVEELIRLMKITPDALAIFPMQVKRNSSDILASIIPDENGKIELNQSLVPARTGHFGLTIIDLKKLQTMSEPWLCSLPDAETKRWDGNKLDSDIYFWTKAVEECNMKVYLAPQIKLGHMELMCNWVDKDLKVCHQSLTDYEQNGRPKTV